MAEKIQIKAVEMVRRIRDEQAQMLAGKSSEEIIDFFRKAGEAARKSAKRRQTTQSCDAEMIFRKRTTREKTLLLSDTTLQHGVPHGPRFRKLAHVSNEPMPRLAPDIHL